MPSKYDFKQVEPKIMRFWKENSIYQKAKDSNKGKKPFYFLDGPPYTSGKVHLGTAWNKSLKDCILRYRRMKGFDVWDRAGYDMHGLPTENAAQKKLGLKTNQEIKDYGVPKFIEECKQLCIDNMRIMNEDFLRLGVWMDFENAYQSIKKEFMESEWWLIKQAHKKGRLYQGLRTMTWCQISESALAKHELEYKTVKDDSIFVKFPIKGKEKEFLVIWTTTPWTIPFNLAVMVNPDIEYLKVKVGDEYWIVASALANVFISSVVGKKFEVESQFKGEKMEGMEYIHPMQDELGHIYDGLKKRSKKVHTILLSTEYVDTTAGSGLVHCAPGCGPEDYEIGHRNGIPPFNNLDRKGIFPEEMGKFAGLTAKKDDDKFIQALEESGDLIAKTEIEHEYPHDWRHHQPVIFRTTKQWFFKVEDLKEKMIKANNDITWVPKAAFNAFDSWLKNLRDNSISKQRFWGTPLPIWRNVEDEKDYIVVGSAQELEELSGQKVDDLHISTVDKIEFEKNGKKYKRIPDILDVWVDAGTVSWNCLDYPQNKEHFDRLFPAEFILEGKDQIRGWFNLLMVASMIALDKPSFKNVYMHGFVQDAKGRKMSKSLGNYILPEEVIDQYGVDTFRYYMIAGANPGVDLNYNFEDMKVRHKNLTVLWNVHNYLLDLAKNYGLNPAKISKVKAFGREEQYMFSRLNSTIKKATEAYDQYKLNEVPDLIEQLYLDLSRTYIQLIRDKAALGGKEDKELVVFTIYRCLIEAVKMLATVSPFISEEIFQNLKEAFSLERESIHLSEWPKVMESLINEKLEKEMDVSQNAIQNILAGREKIQRGVRWPLKEVTIVTLNKEIREYLQRSEKMIKSQTNVKLLKVSNKVEHVKSDLKPNVQRIEEDFPKNAAAIIAKLTQDNAETILTHLAEKHVHEVKVNEAKFSLKQDHFHTARSSPENLQEMEFKYGFIYLNKELNPSLEAEGFSRELMRRVQSLRKKSGLEKKDHINLIVRADAEMVKMFEKWKSNIKEKVGAAEIVFATEAGKELSNHSQEKVKGKEFEIWLEKV
ncbi:isoleucine--tRNA ligase [Candidatus Woesearchaeota archaeon]|nr:isoleucine--tRNA ligase [Candidatus Woesearchaeota archaeon]